MEKKQNKTINVRLNNKKKGMLGLAFVPFIFLIGTAMVGLSAALLYIRRDSIPGQFYQNPFEIFLDAGNNLPIDALYDLFFGGIFGVLMWLNDYIILPLISLPFNERVNPWFGFLLMGTLFSFTIWKKKERVYAFITKYTVITIIILILVFGMGVLLTYMNLI